MLKDKTIIEAFNVDRSIVTWMKYLQSAGKHKLSTAFATDSATDFQLIQDLQLPTFNSHQMMTAEFLRNFTYFQENFVHARYYVVLLPIREKHIKYYSMNIQSLAEAKEFIVQNTEGLYDQYMLKISEFEPNVYGGSIISDDGMVIVEMVRGMQSSVAHGTTNIVSGVLTPLNISMSYSTSDEMERNLLWNALRGITRDNKKIAEDILNHIELHTIRDLSFLKGYFEFAYVKRNDSPCLRLVFFDLKLNKAYRDLHLYSSMKSEALAHLEG